VQNQQRGYSSQKFYSKNQNQPKKDYGNYSKAQSFPKSSKSLFSKGAQYSYHPKSPTMIGKIQRKPSTSSNSNYAYAAVKPQKPASNDQSGELNKYYEMCNYFASKQNSFKGINKVGAFLNYAGDEKTTTISELNGFKIVQNGMTIHDETFDGKSEATKKHNFLPFSFEDKLRPHSESALTFGPGPRLIPLPTFIEAQE